MKYSLRIFYISSAFLSSLKVDSFSLRKPVRSELSTLWCHIQGWSSGFIFLLDNWRPEAYICLEYLKLAPSFRVLLPSISILLCYKGCITSQLWNFEEVLTKMSEAHKKLYKDLLGIGNQEFKTNTHPIPLSSNFFNRSQI